MIFKTASVDSIVIYFGDEIDEKLLDEISFYYKSLKSLNDPDIISIIPSYTSIYIRYNLVKFSEKSIISYLKKLLKDFDKKRGNGFESKLIKIPTFYDTSVGLDLKRLSKEKNLAIEEIIALHSKKTYLVYAVGFIPGYAYLAKVDKKIATPRLKHPRDLIPKGSLAIADTQTAVYPKESPGGWNIIGRTPLELFDPATKELSPFSIGDKVKFEPISKEKFLEIGGEI